MKNRIFFGLMVFFVFLSVCSLPIFAKYLFLSPEANEYLKEIKWKNYGVKEIICKKEEEIVWIVVLSRNDEVMIRQVQEEIGGRVYTIIEITVINSQGESRIVWGFSAKKYPYDIPRLCFPLDS